MAVQKKNEIVVENEQVIASAQVTAAVFGVTVRTINDWSKKGCPKVKKGWYNLREVMDWRFSTENSPEGLEAKKQKADIRYREARADMEELKRKNMVGEYVAIDDIRQDVQELFSIVKTGLFNIKQKVLQDLHATYPECAYDVADLVEREIEKGLKAIARAKL